MNVKSLLLVSAAALVVSCSSPQSADDFSKVCYASIQKLQDAPLESEGKIPTLRAKLPNTWSAKMERSDDGHYRLSYTNTLKPFERLVIYGYPKAIENPSSPPAESINAMINDELGEILKPQEWKSVALPHLNTSVRYFAESSGSGADGDYYGTEVFQLTAPNGKVGFYRLVVETMRQDPLHSFKNVSF